MRGGGAASLPSKDALQGDSFCIPCPSPSEPVLCLLLVMEMIYVPGKSLELFGEMLFSGEKSEENKRIGAGGVSVLRAVRVFFKTFCFDALSVC